MTRHAEIAGGGISGLTLGMMLKPMLESSDRLVDEIIAGTEG